MNYNAQVAQQVELGKASHPTMREGDSEVPRSLVRVQLRNQCTVGQGGQSDSKSVGHGSIPWRCAS